MVQYKKEELLLSATNVKASYGDKTILHDINFQIHNITRPGMEQGQVVSIVGRSGIGKSTLFNLISGFLHPTEGEIKIDSDQHIVQKGEVGVVTQDYVVLNHRTIYENFKIALRGSKESKEIIEEYSSYFDLHEHLKKYPSELSGGQRQRVSILQQILAGNTFILLDEPFSGLDVLMKKKVLDLLLKVSTLNEKNTLIIISHDIVSSCAISDTVFVMARDEDKEGATIIKSYDFLEMGLAYQPGIKSDPRFIQVIQEIESII
jgi:ABC-type nitrate/sulfonate/bicarbonate transport system ATPase subunit